MKKLFLLYTLCGILFTACEMSFFSDSDVQNQVETPDNDNDNQDNTKIPNYQIWYTTTHAHIIYPKESAFDAVIKTNVYSNGKGVISFDKDIKNIGKEAFKDCSSLVCITIPNSVKVIEEKAFYGCTNLTSTTIPNNVTVIGEDAFSSCYNLSELTIGNNVKTIKKRAFMDCSQLTSITIPDCVTDIEWNAFAYCNFKSITLGAGVKRIGGGAFASHTEKIKYCYCKATIPPSIGDRFSCEYLYVPPESIDVYKAADGWSEYADNIEGYEF